MSPTGAASKYRARYVTVQLFVIIIHSSPRIQFNCKRIFFIYFFCNINLLFYRIAIVLDSMRDKTSPRHQSKCTYWLLFTVQGLQFTILIPHTKFKINVSIPWYYLQLKTSISILFESQFKCRYRRNMLFFYTKYKTILRYLFMYQTDFVTFLNKFL
jgi:hypothetical protein